MKVLLFNGSPHKEGCTYTALREVEQTLQADGIETELVWIGAKPVAGCTACGQCGSTGRCIFDDGVNDFVEKMKEADGVVFGSPVYYAGMSGQLCSFMDRLFYVGSKSFDGKLAASVVSCRRGGAATTFEQMNKYYTISNMPVVSSQYWNQVHGNNAQQVLEDKEGLQTMRTLAHNMSWLLKCIEAGRKAGVPSPIRENKINTNFIR